MGVRNGEPVGKRVGAVLGPTLGLPVSTLVGLTVGERDGTEDIVGTSEFNLPWHILHIVDEPPRPITNMWKTSGVV